MIVTALTAVTSLTVLTVSGASLTSQWRSGPSRGFLRIIGVVAALTVAGGLSVLTFGDPTVLIDRLFPNVTAIRAGQLEDGFTKIIAAATLDAAYCFLAAGLSSLIPFRWLRLTLMWVATAWLTLSTVNAAAVAAALVVGQ